MISINKQGSISLDSVENVEGLRLQFNREHCVCLRQLLAPELLEFIRQGLDKAEFQTRVHECIGSNAELCMTYNSTSSLLHLLLNNQRVFELIQSITQCGPIGCFLGRVYRVVPGCGHHDSWHSDLGDHRLVALSINLSREVYTGGILQIRERQAKQLIHEVANTGFGDAIVFRLAADLQHRLTEVGGRVPKTAFAGWFKSQPSFWSVLKGQSQSGSQQLAANAGT